MTGPIHRGALSTLRLSLAIALFSGSIALTGCTGEPTPTTSTEDPVEATAADPKADSIPKPAGGKRGLMDGVPVK